MPSSVKIRQLFPKDEKAKKGRDTTVIAYVYLLLLS
jgi:hypothetical protein